jgi:hypothetical protein
MPPTDNLTIDEVARRSLTETLGRRDKDQKEAARQKLKAPTGVV